MYMYKQYGRYMYMYVYIYNILYICNVVYYICIQCSILLYCRCFKVYTDTTFWYPHSVEEMIIWTVERDKSEFISFKTLYTVYLLMYTFIPPDCKFSEFIESISRIPGREASPKASGPPSKQTIDKQNPAAVPAKAIPVKTVSKSTVAVKPPGTNADPMRHEFQYAAFSTMHGNATQPTHTAVTMAANILRPGLPRRVDPIGTLSLNKLPLPLPGFSPGIRITVPMATNPLGMLSAHPAGAYNGVSKHPGNSTYQVQASQTPLAAVVAPISTSHTSKFSCLCTCFALPYVFLVVVYKLGEVNFKTVAEIPAELLQGISACFSSKKEVCRICFYEERLLSDIVQATNTCNNGNHQWNKPLFIIKGNGSTCMIHCAIHSCITV